MIWKRFLGPVIIGIIIAYFNLLLINIGVIDGLEKILNIKLDDIFIIRFFYTLSENYLAFLMWFAPLMTLVYIASAIKNLQGDIKIFMIRFLTILFSTLLILGLTTLVISILVVPYFISEQNVQIGLWPESYFVIALSPMFNVFTAIIFGGLIGAFIDPKGIVSRVVDESELIINKIVKRIIIPLSFLWIVGSFAASTYSLCTQNGSEVCGLGGLGILKYDLLLSGLILLIQFLWVGLLLFITSKYSKIAFKKLVKAASRVYVIVFSLAGNSTGVIVPIIIDEQKKLGINEQKAKFVTASSFNMPGSLISHIVFMYGVLMIFDYQVPLSNILIYIIALIFVLSISPAISGGVFAITSSLLNPILGFSAPMINMMSTMYFKQGTSNAAINNISDFYLTPLSMKKSEFKGVEVDDQITKITNS